MKIIEALQTQIYNYKNTRSKLLKRNAAIWFNKISKTRKLASKVKHLNCKLYYRQQHFKCLCNMASYCLQVV